MGSQQQFCLRWNNHQSNMLSVFDDLFQNEALVDVTLACDGLSIKAHKMVLSACSPYFQTLFLDNPCKHPIVILKDIRFSDLKSLMDFMYKGEVNVNQSDLQTLLKTAETLKVRGLTEVASGSDLHNSILLQPGLGQNALPRAPTSSSSSSSQLPVQAPPSQSHQTAAAAAVSSPSPKRKKARHRFKSERSSSQSELDESESPDLMEPKVEITEDTNLDDDHLGAGDENKRLHGGGALGTHFNDFSPNTTQGVTSTQDANHKADSQSFGGRQSNVLTLNTTPSSLLFSPSTAVPTLASGQSIGQPQVLQGTSQALPPQMPILMASTGMMNLPTVPSTSRQDSVLRRIPERLRPRPCKICNKIISNASNMIKHMLVHNPVKIPFRCNLCDCKYSREETLRWHYRVKHGITRLPLGREDGAGGEVGGGGNASSHLLQQAGGGGIGGVPSWSLPPLQTNNNSTATNNNTNSIMGDNDMSIINTTTSQAGLPTWLQS